MKITAEQKEILVEFMRGHPELISGKFSASFTKKDGEALWKQLEQTLNSTIGPQKEWKAWRKTWQDLCARAKQKTAANKRELNKTGGGVGNFQSMSTTEKTIAEMLSPVAVQGLNVPTPQVTFVAAPVSDHPPSPSVQSTSSIPASPHGSSAHPSPRQSPRIASQNAETFPRNAPTATSRTPINKGLRKRISTKNAYAEHAKYLQKKLEMREKYYVEKLALMRSMAESFQAIANALILRQ